MPKNEGRLPNEIIALPNKDKKFHEKWKKGRNKANIPHPFRAVLMGPPNCGKGCAIKNLILRAKPEFEEIVVVHPDPEYTQEWNDINATMLSEIPVPEEWEGEVKTLVILDDLEYNGMNKEQKRALDRLFGYCSTHKNISVCLTAQDCFSIPAIVRRTSNLFIFWKMLDLDALSNISRKTGMKSNDFKDIFQLCKDSHDSLWLDLTDKSPYPLRLNCFKIIEKKELSDEANKQLKNFINNE